VQETPQSIVGNPRRFFAKVGKSHVTDKFKKLPFFFAKA
jgi:hypothetical protein